MTSCVRGHCPTMMADGMMAGRSRKSNFCKWMLDMFRQRGANVLPSNAAFKLKRSAYTQ